MLVLTRKQSETIRIGDSITITVLKMKGKSVRLGIEAPHSLSVIRGELSFDKDDDDEVLAEADENETRKLSSPAKRTGGRRSQPNDTWRATSNSAAGSAAAVWCI